MENLILTINPGSTSTKVGIFKDEKQIAISNISHPDSQIHKFESIFDQLDYRTSVVKNFLADNKVKIEELSAIVGRGGPICPLTSGTYIVDDKMVETLKTKYTVLHISILGGLIARNLAGNTVKNVFIVDPVCVDEMCEEARISGHPLIKRESLSHALNIKSVGRMAAKDLKTPYDKLNLVIAHLGSGVSVTAHDQGKMVDVNNAYDEGPFSIDRTGGLPLRALIETCCSGIYTKKQVQELFMKKGGIIAYLNTNDGRVLEEMFHAGDPKAILVTKGLCHQISKEIGAMATVLRGKVDAIVLTGGLAHFKELVEWIKERVSFISKVVTYPGEDELASMASGAYRVISGQEQAKKLQ
ncbi:MAG TPA: butyrate kinase [Candidatus Wallbacteria bacterium]|nr:butyrate kinase [Candidatus Wallbacteria bacterium]